VSPTLLRDAEEILRAGSAESSALEPGRARRAAIYFLACTGAYGALMGTFGGLRGDRLLLVLYAALKVPLLLLVTGAVCMPSFFILNTLFGLRADFPRVLHALSRTQAGFAILLLSLAPYTLFWYASFADYNAAILFNTGIFGVASLAAQWMLRRLYQPLVAENPRHRILLYAWLGLFAFVGIQTAWILRPFIGSPDLPAQFFREEAWGNAYVALAEKFAYLFK
jgi:hypothetical protein